jgi:hypothetical protein
MGDNIRLGAASFVYLDGTQVGQLFDLNVVDETDNMYPTEGFGLNVESVILRSVFVKRSRVTYALFSGCGLVHRWRNHSKARKMICRSMRRKQNARK